MKLSLVFIFILQINFSSCQVYENTLQTKETTGKLFIDPEINASFPGGENEMFCFIDRTINKSIIDTAKIEGKVYARIVIDSTGKLKDFIIIKSYSKQIDEEFLRVLKLMPNWIPAKTNERPVEQTLNFPLALPYNRKLFCN